MPIEAVISATPCLQFEPDDLPKKLHAWRNDMRGESAGRCWWIVPTSRRRRQMIRQKEGSSLPPRTTTIDGLLEHLTGFARFFLSLLGDSGRLLRIAQAWRETHGADAYLTPGRVEQLDQIAAEWRECGRLPPDTSPYAGFVRTFGEILKRDRCADRPQWIKSITEEIEDAKSPLAGCLAKIDTVLFDGFHRFTEIEMAFIIALAKRTKVRVWFASSEKSSFHDSVAAMLTRLAITRPIIDNRPAASPIAQTGRTLFSNQPCPRCSGLLELYEASNAEAERNIIACRIKELKRSWGDAGRLADIAVVVPDAADVLPMRSTLVVAGIACNAAAQHFPLAQSRPARTLLSAIRLIRHAWPNEALFDFLRQPLIRRKLAHDEHLDQLEELSPRRSLRRNWPAWHECWLKAISEYRQAIEDADDKEKADPKIRQRQAEDLLNLVESIGLLLEPVGRFENELAANDPAAFAEAIAHLLDAVEVNRWLSPTSSDDRNLIPQREWEIDQLAFMKLKDALRDLATTPADNLPRGRDNKIDIEAVLQLILGAVQYQIGSEDDAGVQIVRAATIRGLRFRALFATGLLEGKVPIDRADLLPAAAEDVGLDESRQRDSFEQQYLFAQLFESAGETLILTRALQAEGVELIESPFLRRLKAKTGLEAKPAPNEIVAPSQAVLFSGQTSSDNVAALRAMREARKVWNASRQDPKALQIKPWALPLLELRYPEDRLFSATALEKYAACPFQHFVTKTLGLEEMHREDTALRTGLFVHQVLEDFFKQWKEQNSEPSFNRAKAKPLFDQVFQAEWEKHQAAFDSTLEHDFSNALTDAYLNVVDHLAANQFHQVAAEWEFTVSIPDGAGRSIMLYGKIDRIDSCDSPEGKIEMISDFKTGSVYRATKLRKRLATGRLLQLPLYAMARQLSTGVPVRQGVYVQLNRKVDGEPSKHTKFLVHVGNVLDPKSKIGFDPEGAARLAVQLAHNMRRGSISLTLYDSGHPDPACGTACSARHACRHVKGY